MHQAGLVACQPRKRARTTIPAQDLGYRPDLVKRNFTANKPGQKRGGRGQSSSPIVGRIRLSSDRDGLLPEMKIIGYAIAEVYAHPTYYRGFTHGSQKSTPYRG